MTRRLLVPRLHRIAFAMLFVGTTTAYAASLGQIQLLSALGQPLHATIPLSNDNTNDLESACVRARLEQSDGTFISTPRISLTHSARAGVIDLSTKQGINEPAIVLHVEIGCGTAIQRNYQLLLDPVNGAATAATASRRQKATDLPGTSTQRTVPIEVDSRVKAAAGTQRKQSPLKESVNASRADNLPLPTLTKEMSLSSGQPSRKTPSRTSSAANDAKWVPEESITPVLKLSASLADATSVNDASKAEEFRADQIRFAAILNGEDVTQNAEAKMKAAQEQMLRLQAENEQKKLKVQSEQAAQDEIRKVSYPITWFAGLGALVLLCMAVIGWIIFKIVKARRSPATHPWKNYHAASDTLIADLSTQTMLDSEFLNSESESYNTAVFSDTEFDMDPVTQCDIPDEVLEDSVEEEHDIPEYVTTNPDSAAPLTHQVDDHEAEDKPVEKPAAFKKTEQTARESSVQPKAELSTKAPARIETPASVLPPTLPPGTAVQEPKQQKHDASQSASAPIAKQVPAPTMPAPAPAKNKETALTLGVKEIADIMQQAEFWMLLQDPFRAIEILEPYRDVAHPESPAPWIYLLDLYRMVGDKKKYELLLVRIEYVFNAKIPRWDGQFGITPRTLNDFPHVVEKICALWETDQIVPYLESLLHDQRDGTRQGFDLPVYRNIVQLITLASEPDKSKEHEQLRYGKAQAILFSQQSPYPTQAEPAPPAKPATPAVASTIIQDEPVTTDAKLETANVAPTPAIAAIDVDTTNTLLLDEPTIDVSSSHAEVHEEKNADDANDTVDYDNASPMETKLELALAYQEIGEKDGARELLYEVIKDGSPAQSEKAKLILKKIN
jgi:pilus assembly protein FimV